YLRLNALAPGCSINLRTADSTTGPAEARRRWPRTGCARRAVCGPRGGTPPPGCRGGPAARVVDRLSRRRGVGACELGGELLELGRSRVALVATLERVQPAFAQRLVELDEQGG